MAINIISGKNADTHELISDDAISTLLFTGRYAKKCIAPPGAKISFEMVGVS